MKLEKKFYVAARAITDPNSEWVRATKEEAIQHARELLASQEEDEERPFKARLQKAMKLYVVQIIAVVQKELPPMKVEDVE